MWLFASAIFLFETKQESAIRIASLPLIRTIAIPEMPGGVTNATIVSSNFFISNLYLILHFNIDVKLKNKVEKWIMKL